MSAPIFSYPPGGGSSGPTYGVFSANLAANQIGSAGAYNTVLFDTIIEDDDNLYNEVTGQYIPQESGYYLVGISVGTVASAVETGACSIWKNGAFVADGFYLTTSELENAFIGSNISALVPMNGTTDYIEFVAYLASGGDATIYGFPSYTFGFAYKVSDL